MAEDRWPVGGGRWTVGGAACLQGADQRPAAVPDVSEEMTGAAGAQSGQCALGL